VYRAGYNAKMRRLREVSVILPAFNRLEYLRAAVESVLAQTHTDWELIIADDESGDVTRTFLDNLDDNRITRLRLGHCGIPAVVRNKAIQHARSPYLAFLDSDDVWMPRKLERQLDVMRSRRDRRWSYTGSREIDEHGDPLPGSGSERWSPCEGAILEPMLTFNAHIATPSVVAERSLVNEVGGFDEEQHYGEDFDLWVRLALRSEVSVVPEPLVCIRNQHADRYSRDRVAAYHSWLRLYGKMGEMVPDGPLRSLCRRRRGATSLILAGLYVDRRDTLGVFRTVLAASAYAWPYPDWWWGACRAIVRPAIPRRLRSMYRRMKNSP
jgi:glycosyltransferase involved in cell wall biosynthesis